MPENTDIKKVTVEGRVARVTYKNKINGFTVLILSAEKDNLCCVGSMPFVNEGDNVLLTGSYTTHPVYGEQLKVESCERQAPSTTVGILRYLSSGAIRGVGPATATRLVEKFGDKTLEIIENEPQRLAQVKGISPEKAELICAEYKAQFGIRDLMVYLSRFKVTPETAVKIYAALGCDAVGLIENNPYLLCGEEIAQPFELCEQIASYLELPPDFDERINSGVEYVLQHNLMNGHTCLPEDKLCAAASRLLSCEYDKVEAACRYLVESLRLNVKTINGETFLFLPKMYAAETYIAAKLTQIANSNSAQINAVYDLEVEYIENLYKIKYDIAQKNAIMLALSSSIMVLTGGPGTGKTTTLNGIITLLERQGKEVVLAAPTGRAAKRITELTNRQAKTLHRLLEAGWDDDKTSFAKNEMNPLDGDVFVIDEMSMVDALLFESFLRALKPGARIILVGDADQLPSVGAGNLLYDIIASGKLPCISLNKVFRQAMQSLIVKNAHKIIRGEHPDISHKDADFFMINCKDAQTALQKVIDLCSERLPSAYGYSPFSDIQVLCPSKMADLGTRNLNTYLQNKLNPQKSYSQRFSSNGYYLIEGDKVIQTKNNYNVECERPDGTKDLGVYNGDIGIIKSIDKRTEKVTVAFDDRVANYNMEDAHDLEPAYAITVHKSQGSEFECVILPLFDTPKKLCYRNLLYTAVTRAKKMLVAVGNQNVMFNMADNSKKALRYTALCAMLKEK